jgi:hypothetical protein
MAVVIRDGYNIEATSSNDVVISVASVWFPCKRLSYAKTIEVKEEWGTGSHLPYALTTHNIGFTGSFDVGTWLSDGDRHALTYLLEDQADEGIPIYFDIMIMDRFPSKDQDAGTVSTGNVGRAVFEKLLNCKVTKSGRDYPENNTVLTQYEFKAMERSPL